MKKVIVCIIVIIAGAYVYKTYFSAPMVHQELQAMFGTFKQVVREEQKYYAKTKKFTRDLNILSIKINPPIKTCPDIVLGGHYISCLKTDRYLMHLDVLEGNKYYWITLKDEYGEFSSINNYLNMHQIECMALKKPNHCQSMGFEHEKTAKFSGQTLYRYIMSI